MLVWYTTGVDPFPVGFTDNLLGGHASTRSGIFNFLGSDVYRMSSLGGEPKSLGGSLAVGALIAQIAVIYSVGRTKRQFNWLIIFLLASLIATFSTTAFILYFVGSIVFMFILSVFNVGDKRHRPQKVKILGRFGLSVVAIILVSSAFDWKVSDIIYERTLGRIEGSELSILEDSDAAVIGYLRDEPMSIVFGVGLGNIHLYANSYLLPSAAWYMSGTAFVAKAAYLRIISELGLVGLFLFLIWQWRLLRGCRDLAKTEMGGADLSLSFYCGSVILLAFFMVGATAPLFWLMSGCIIALLKILQQRTDASTHVD